MRMDVFETAMLVAAVIYSPLLLFLWVSLLARIGYWLYAGACNLRRAHSRVDARIIDQRQVSTRIHGRRRTWLGLRTVYRLRYEFGGAVHEIEYLVIDEQQVMLDKQAGIFKLYVPHNRPGHAHAESHPNQLPYAVFLVAAMAYSSWLLAPFLLFWKV